MLIFSIVAEIWLIKSVQSFTVMTQCLIIWTLGVQGDGKDDYHDYKNLHV